MKNIVVFLLVLYSTIFEVSAQTHNFLTTREEPFMGYRIKQGNEYLKRKQVTSMMEINPLALEIFNTSSKHRTIGLTSMWIGTGLFTYGIIRDSQGQNALPLLIVSSIILIPGPYFIISSRNKDREAIDIYNFDLCCKTGAHKTKTEIRASVFPPKLSLTFK